MRGGAYWRDAPFAVCAVDPLSGIRRAPDLFPVDGDFASPVRLMAAQDEYEGASFLLFGFGVKSYAFAMDEAYLRGLMIVYPADHDIIDTLAWEGCREAVDDIRYATLLRQLAEKARASGDTETVYAGRAALAWVAQVDHRRSSLESLRLEMVRRILDIQALLAKN